MCHQIDQILQALRHSQRGTACPPALVLYAQLCPALAADTHIALFYVQMRHQIDQILEELWRDERCTSCHSLYYAHFAPPQLFFQTFADAPPD
jgi:hypothetical protein